MKQSENTILKDILLYFLGASVPMLVLVIRSPIYTRIFSPQEYGEFALVNITFTYLSALTFTWILSCSLRYYNKYKNSNNLNTYYKILSLLMVLAGITMLLIAVIWFFLTKSPLTKQLLIYGAVFFISEKILHTSLTPIRLEKRAQLFNLLKSSNAIVSFSLLLILTFVKNLRIEAFYIAPAIINILFFTILRSLSTVKFTLNFRNLPRKDFMRFLNYGYASLGLGFGLFLLVSSDRYIIAYYFSESEVGIYNQVYNLAQISLTGIINIFQAATNPTLFNYLEKTPQQSKNILSRYAFMGSFIYLPLAVLGSIFAKQFAFVMLGEEFRIAWKMLPWIFAGVFLNGLIHFYTIRMKFLNFLKILVYGAFAAAAINIILNLIFIPLKGYEFAAITTLISYVFLFMVYYFKSDAKIIIERNFYIPFLKLAFCLFIILLIHFGLKYFRNGDINLEESIIALIFYLGFLFITTRNFNPFIKRNTITEAE